MDEAKGQHFILMGLIVLGLLAVAMFVPNLSTYAFIGAVFMAGFMIYLKITEGIDEFVSENYDADLSRKLFANATYLNKGKIKEIYLTGEDKFPMVKIGNCEGYYSYSFDIVPEKWKEIVDSVSGTKRWVEDYEVGKDGTKETKSIELVCFYYQIFSENFFIKFLQSTTPKIPIWSNIIKVIPFINQFFFPKNKGVITTDDRCVWKMGVVEIKGKSLIPLSVKIGFDTYDLVEYSGKLNETRKMEKYFFVKEIDSDFLLQMVNNAKNQVEASAKMNPNISLNKEKNIMKSR